MLYAIPMIDSQRPLIDKYCFGICGKLSLSGAIEIKEAGGYCWVCLHKECSYEKGRTDAIGTSGITGDQVCIRGLFEILDEEGVVE